MLRRARTRRALATVLFTDIVGSTERAQELGDAAWRALLAQHHRIIRRALRRHRGHEVDTAGDGFFATFDQPADAVACALEAADAISALGIQIRAGIHTGEVEPMGKKVGGIAVHLGARILSTAEPGQILVSGTVRDLVAGAGFSFRDIGARQLKGVTEEWRLFSVDRPVRVGPALPADTPETSTRIPGLLARGALLLALAGASALGAFLVARGPAGNATASSVNVVRPVGADGALGDAIAVGWGPAAITVADGAIWVANTSGGPSRASIPTAAQTPSLAWGCRSISRRPTA